MPQDSWKTSPNQSCCLDRVLNPHDEGLSGYKSRTFTSRPQASLRKTFLINFRSILQYKSKECIHENYIMVKNVQAKLWVEWDSLRGGQFRQDNIPWLKIYSDLYNLNLDEERSQYICLYSPIKILSSYCLIKFCMLACKRYWRLTNGTKNTPKQPVSCLQMVLVLCCFHLPYYILCFKVLTQSIVCKILVGSCLLEGTMMLNDFELCWLQIILKCDGYR